MMRQIKRIHNFFLCFLLHLVLNFEGLLPAALLLILHFWLHISIWWFVAALSVWMVWMLLHTLLIVWANHCGNAPVRTQTNKNPYSLTNQETFPASRPTPRDA